MSEQSEQALGEQALGKQALGEQALGKRTSSDAQAGGPHFAVQQQVDQMESVPAEPDRPQEQGSPQEQDQNTEATNVHQLVAIDLKKSYRMGTATVPVLTGTNLGVHRGEFLAIVGQSGSGKSTLLHLLGTLDAPDSGEIYFGDRRIDNIPSAQRDELRNKYFGMIFQFYHLLPELNTLENVLMPLMIANSTWAYMRRRREYRRVAKELLELVGLGHRLKHKPRELSGGEMQRAAIARALVTRPELLLADEPTGNLDKTTGQEILDILGRLNEEQNLTIVMVTHDLAIADRADRIVRLVEGQVETRD